MLGASSVASMALRALGCCRKTKLVSVVPDISLITPSGLSPDRGVTGVTGQQGALVIEQSVSPSRNISGVGIEILNTRVPAYKEPDFLQEQEGCGFVCVTTYGMNKIQKTERQNISSVGCHGLGNCLGIILWDQNTKTTTFQHNPSVTEDRICELFELHSTDPLVINRSKIFLACSNNEGSVEYEDYNQLDDALKILKKSYPEIPVDNIFCDVHTDRIILHRETGHVVKDFHVESGCQKIEQFIPIKTVSPEDIKRNLLEFKLLLDEYRTLLDTNPEKLKLIHVFSKSTHEGFRLNLSNFEDMCTKDNSNLSLDTDSLVEPEQRALMIDKMDDFNAKKNGLALNLRNLEDTFAALDTPIKDIDTTLRFCGIKARDHIPPKFERVSLKSEFHEMFPVVTDFWASDKSSMEIYEELNKIKTKRINGK